ncbi:MAG: histidine phosphatase family protein [Nitrosomonas sp.]|nr:histidine phosphatase family protein [Nitrosomonas sp.]MBK7365674.1 histidine phosphatase family protein [Nitrosomonas sp.]
MLLPDTIVDLIRHGEPAGGQRYRGHRVDDPLTEKGWSQMWNSVGEYQKWTNIITSPLQRCSSFAFALGERLNIPVTVESRFKEVGFGIWEGLSHDEVRNNRAEEFQAFIADPVNCRPQGAEPLDTFLQRVNLAYEEIIRVDQSHHYLIVAHAGVIRAIIARTAHVAPSGFYRIKISNGGITRIRHTKTGVVLELLNGTLSGNHPSL